MQSCSENKVDCFYFVKLKYVVSVVVQQKRIRLGTMRLWVRSLALLRGLRIQHCRELWCKLQIWLRSCISVAVAALIRPLAWDPPYVLGVALKSQRKKEKKKKKKEGYERWVDNNLISATKAFSIWEVI